MKTSTVLSQFKPQVSAESGVVYSRKRGLAATWVLVDGKLTCKWFPVDSNNQV